MLKRYRMHKSRNQEVSDFWVVIYYDGTRSDVAMVQSRKVSCIWEKDMIYLQSLVW